MKEQEILAERQALLEMYKAGFLDGYSRFKKPKTEEDHRVLNKNYKLAFMKRFEKKITKVLKKKS